ncbi:hypothetical protein ABIB48_002385 [Arthrobacter sp. UYCu511]
MMVVGSPDQAGTALLAGEIPCPHCSTPLRPTGTPVTAPCVAWARSG